MFWDLKRNEVLTMINVKRLEELNRESKVELTSEETELADETFQSAIKIISSSVAGEYVRNRIKIRLAEMFDNEVETNL